MGAAIALAAGAVLALTSGDVRSVVVLALGVLGGWAAAHGLAARPAAAADEPPIAAPAPRPCGTQLAPPTSTPSSGPTLPTSPAAAHVADSVAASAASDAADGPFPTTSRLPNVAECTPPVEPERVRAPAPGLAPEPTVVPTPVPVAAGAVSAVVAAQQGTAALPDDVVEIGDERHGEASTRSAEPRPDAALPAGPASADAAFDANMPLPTEVRLQDLAARQRSSTADLRRSIRDVIERLEDDEPPAPRRRGKKPRR